VLFRSKLFLGEKVNTIEKIRENFAKMDNIEKLKIIGEMLRVVQGSNQNLKELQGAGLGTTAQQLKNKDDLIAVGSTIIYQSPTGLYETRKKL
jgi:hypothetical protein